MVATTTAPAPHHRPSPTLRTTSAPGWRDVYLVVLTCMMAYSTAIAWQAQVVSYPLFLAVGAADFAAYHLRYGEFIPSVVIAPGFLTFFAGMLFPWVRPAHGKRAASATVALASLAALVATLAQAIPAHDAMDRVGAAAPAIDTLLAANLLRSAALTIGTLALAGSLLHRVRQGGTATRS
jgi:hypothetical protein